MRLPSIRLAAWLPIFPTSPSEEQPDRPSLRALREHILIVRPQRARRMVWLPPILLSSLVISLGMGTDFTSKGSLVDPRLRASNEHIAIVRIPRAGGRLGCPSHPSEAARCASTEDHQAPSPSPIPTGPRRPTTSLRPSRPAAPTRPSVSICSIIRAARG